MRRRRHSTRPPARRGASGVRVRVRVRGRGRGRGWGWGRGGARVWLSNPNPDPNLRGVQGGRAAAGAEPNEQAVRLLRRLLRLLQLRLLLLPLLDPLRSGAGEQAEQCRRGRHHGPLVVEAHYRRAQLPVKAVIGHTLLHLIEPQHPPSAVRHHLDTAVRLGVGVGVGVRLGVGEGVGFREG